MNRLRREDGIALVTTVVLTGVMLVMGIALLSIVDTQADQTRKERVGESAFNLAEATLNAQAFLLGRNWPQSAAQTPQPASPAAPCSGQTITGTLAEPAPSASPTLQQQIQGMLAQTHPGQASSGSQWWVTACEAGGRDSWDASLLNGLAYDPSIAANPTAQPRRLWIRAESRVGGHRRAVVSLVQAGQQPVFPSNLAVVTGRFGADLTTTTGQALTGALVGPLVNTLLTSSTDPAIDGAVGLRCSLLDAPTSLALLPDCLAGVFKLTSMTTLSPLLQANEFYDFPSNTTINPENLAQLRQQAQSTSTYYPKDGAGLGTVAAGAPCLPVGAAGKIVFIEQIGNGTGSCVLNPTSTPAARALIVGAGGVRVTGGGTFTGVIYALHRTALASNAADIRIEGPSKVVGGAYADDNPALPAVSRRGQVLIVPPPVSLSGILPGVCTLLPLLCDTLDEVIGLLGVNTVLAHILPQLNASLPAIVNNPDVVKAVSTLGDSGVVTGTFRQVRPQY